MNKYSKLITTLLISIGMVACTGSSSSSNGGGNNPTPANITATLVNIGNITTIPTGNGSSGRSTVTVSNNLGDQVILQKATYTLHQSNTPATTITASAGGLIDDSQCKTIGAHGVCSLGVRVPDDVTQGQYSIQLEYKDIATNKLYIANNMVSYSEAVPVTDTGVRYSSQNNNVYNEAGGTTTLTIPFQLTKNYSKLTAQSNNDNPVFAPTISCPGNSYTAGTLCNLYVRVSNTGTSSLIAGGVTINGEAPVTTQASVQNIKAANVTGQTGYVFGVPITVSQNVTGNLVTSAINTVINPSDGTSAQPVTLLNNGAATIDSINVTGANPIQVSSNTCSSLAPGASCTFNVNVTSTISGQSSVIVNYNNGATTGNTSGVLAFNVIYIASAVSPTLSITTGGSMLNVAKDMTTTTTLVVANTSTTATFSNLLFTNPASLSPNYFSWGVGGTCAIDGSQVLTPGTSCTLNLEFTPTAVGTGSVNITASGDWSNPGGNPEVFGSTSSFAWSAINGDAFLYITPNYVSFAIRADGVDTATQTFRVINGGLDNGTINSLNLPAPFVNLGTGTCAVNDTLAINESCTINAQYGPTTTAVVSNTPVQLTVGYKPNANFTTDVLAFANLDYSAAIAALIEVTNVTVTGTAGSYPNYTYVNDPTTPLEVEVTYTNNGTATADGFNVALNSLPVGYVSVTPSGTACSVGSTVTNLESSNSCNVKFMAVNPTGLYNPYALNGMGLSFNIPGFSYTDTNTQTNTNTTPTFDNANAISVNTSLFDNVSTDPLSIADGSNGNMTFNGTNGTIITIPATSLTGFTVGNGRTCTISGGTCTINIAVVAGFPARTANFSYWVTPAGETPAVNNSIIQQGSFDITN